MPFLLIPGVIIAVVIHDLIRRPTIRRLAARNVVRRKGEALLVVVGSLLATAIITAALIVAGTFSDSIRNFATLSLGPTDEVVRVAGAAPLAGVEQALASAPIPGVDGQLSMLSGGAAISTVSTPVKAEPYASILEVDFDKARQFGPHADITGFTDLGPTPTGDEVVVGASLAEEIEVGPGDRIAVNAYGQAREYTVRAIAPKKGVAGFSAPSLFVPQGTIAALTSAPGAAVATPPTGLVLISNEGDLYGGAKRSEAVKAELQKRLEGVPGVEVRAQKQDLLDDADAQSEEFVTLFGGFGAFSVVAGILLLINIFVMLAEERKTELGMLRAVGLKRNQLVRSFGMEGAIYSLLSAIVGAGVGVLVGRLMVVVAESLVNEDDAGPFSLDLVFSAKPSAIFTGFLIGAVISLLTVWGASLRIGRMNVIRAIRDLPEPTLTKQHVRTLVFAAFGVAFGGLMLMNAVSNDAWFGALAGPPIGAFSAIPLVSRLLPRRLAITVPCGLALFWGIGVFSILPDAMQAVDVPAFVVQGMILVAAAVAILAANDDLAVKLTDKLSGSNRTLAARLGFAYPLARRFRTSLLLGMYALIVFTLTFMSVFSNLFSKQGPRFTEETRAGYDLVVDSNYANPVPAEALRAQPQVEGIAPLLRGFPEWTSALRGDEKQIFPVTGFDSSLLERGRPKLASFAPRFTDEAAVWQAVLTDPALIIVSDFFLQEGGGPPDAVFKVGDKVTMFNRLTDEPRELTVAGKMESDWTFTGAFIGADFARTFLGTDVVASRFYVKVSGDPVEVAETMKAGLLRYGVDADTFSSLVNRQLQQQQGFIRLMQGYIGLGLLIGIAGLGVVMIRAVRERRRQIGMLRAMGFSSRIVRISFLLEAGFVALQGIVLGVVLALIVSYQLLSNSATFGDQKLDFSVPWLALFILVSVALAASVAATAAPANQAANIRPAVALRIAD